MNIIIKKFLAGVARCAVLFVLLFILALSARAQVTPTTLIQLTNLPSWYTTNYTTNLFQPGTIPVNNVINLRQGQGMVSTWSFAGTNAASAGTFVLTWAVSADGTNWVTAPGQTLSLTNAANNLVGVIGGTNFPSALLNNWEYIAPYQIQNTGATGGAGIILSNAFASFGNMLPGAYQ